MMKRGVVGLCVMGLVGPGLGGCGKSEPCSGDNKAKDTKPVHADWKKRGGLPKDAVACTLGGKSYDTRKSYELGKTPNEAFDASVKHYVTNSWKELDRNADGPFLTIHLERDGHKLEVQCSKVVDTGWCTASFREKR